MQAVYREEEACSYDGKLGITGMSWSSPDFQTKGLKDTHDTINPIFSNDQTLDEEYLGFTKRKKVKEYYHE